MDWLNADSPPDAGNNKKQFLKEVKHVFEAVKPPLRQFAYSHKSFIVTLIKIHGCQQPEI
jgi:hypothetical protein